MSNSYYTGKVKKFTRLAEVEERRGKVNGNYCSLFKTENVSTALGNILHRLGYETTCGYYYKNIDSTIWKGWEFEAKELVINKIMATPKEEVTFLEAEYGVISDNKINFVMSIMTVEELNRLVNIMCNS